MPLLRLPLVAWLLTLGTWPLLSAPQAYDLRDPKKVNHISFRLDAPLEAISGIANDISGTVLFDPQDLRATRGRVVAPVAQLTVPQPPMQSALHGARWLDAERYPEIVFEAEGAEVMESTPQHIRLNMTGRLSLRGITRELTVPVTLAPLPGRLAERSGPGLPLPPGDLLVVRSRFTIKLSDYNIDRGASAFRVSDEVEISLSLAAMAPHEPDRAAPPAPVAASAQATGATPAPTASGQTDFTNLRATIVSPEVSADRRVTLRLLAPQARSVHLAGGTLLSAIGGSVRAPRPFTRTDDGVWTLTTVPLPPEIHNYRLQIDGADALDYANPNVITGSGSPNNYVEIPPVDGRAFWQPAPGISRGTVHRHRYDSPLGDVREFHVYTPPGYDPAGKVLPVLYLLHGGGELADSWSRIGRLDILADNLIAEGRMQPGVIVMPFGHAIKRGPADSPATPWADRNAAAFERDLFEAIIPLTERLYRVRTDRQGRALAGLSMGAAQTEFIGFRSLDRFSVLGLFSGGGRDFATRHTELLAQPERANTQLRWLYLAVGENDGLVLPTVAPMHELLTKAGIHHTYRLLPGFGHSWPIWRHILYHEFLPGVFASASP